MFVNDLQPVQCVFEFSHGDTIERQVLTAPKIVIIQEITRFGKVMSNNSLPMKLKVSTPFRLYDTYENRWIDRENTIEFQNMAYERKNCGKS